MSIYRKKRGSHCVMAHQWRRNGDHPEDNCLVITPVPGDGEPFLSEGEVVRRYRSPKMDAEAMCEHCWNRMENHGWIDSRGGQIVCVGDYVITEDSENYHHRSAESFRFDYEMVIP